MASDRAPEAPPPLSGADLDPATIERHKDAAARGAAEIVQDGMRVGLGTGSTVAYLLSALGERAAQLRGPALSRPPRRPHRSPGISG